MIDIAQDCSSAQESGPKLSFLSNVVERPVKFSCYQCYQFYYFFKTALTNFITRIFSTFKQHLFFFKTKLILDTIKVCSHCNSFKPFLAYVVKITERAMQNIFLAIARLLVRLLTFPSGSACRILYMVSHKKTLDNTGIIRCKLVNQNVFHHLLLNKKS